jgi:hypothetical protein
MLCCHSWVGKAFGHAVSVGLVRELLVDLREVVLASGILNMSQELSPFAHQMHAAPEQVTGRAHLGGVDGRLREHAPAEQHGDLVGREGASHHDG